MPKLHDIAGISSEAAELLEAVGYLDAHDLGDADAEELTIELVKANEKLGIMPGTPAKGDVMHWQEFATGAVSQELDAAEEAEKEIEEPEGTIQEEECEELHSIDVDPGLVNFEEDPEVQEMLAVSPEAIPLAPALIRRHKLEVPDIPEGILLTQCEGEVEINVMTTSRLAEVQKPGAETKRAGLMSSRIRNFEQYEEGGHHVKPLDKGKPKEAVSASEGLNAGLRPESRRFVRGVLHPHAISVRVSAFCTVLVEVLLAANIIGIPWLLIYDYLSGMSMVGWIVGLMSALFLSALCYLFWGINARCRVCGQRQFAPKKCLKNRKAHYIPVLGYIFPTALHALFFKWFYCTYCGTAVRLKR